MRNFIWVVIGVILLGLPVHAEDLNSIQTSSKQDSVSASEEPKDPATLRRQKRIAKQRPAEAAGTSTKVKKQAILPPNTFSLSLSAAGMISRLKAEDRLTAGTAEFNSSLLSEIKLGIGYKFLNVWKVSAQGAYKQNDFQSIDSGQTVTKPSATNTYELRLHRLFSEFTEVYAGFGNQDRFFSRADSVTSYTFDKATLSFWDIGIDGGYSLKPGLVLGVSGQYKALSSGNANNYEIEAGTESQVGMFLKKQVRNYWYYGNLYYGHSDQNSLYVKQTEDQTGLSLGVTYVY